jgi:4-amino-4-deoxychorismate lyase
MNKFIETINILDGVPQRLFYHTQRMNHTIHCFYPNAKSINLEGILHPQITHGQQKCRIIYSNQIEEITCSTYIKKEIKSLQIIHNNTIDYAFKWTDRKMLNDLLKLKGACDEIIIIKQGYVTDTSYTNIAFYDGEKWYTSDTPLLAGTCRASLIDEGVLSVKNIRETDIWKYKKVSLINAMMNLEELEMPITSIKKDENADSHHIL